MTMAQFAEQLPNLASGYVQTQVLDATGLEGAYDFTMSFSGVNIVRNAGQGRGGAPSEPSAALSLADCAGAEQLRLKLRCRSLHGAGWRGGDPRGGENRQIIEGCLNRSSEATDWIQRRARCWR